MLFKCDPPNIRLGYLLKPMRSFEGLVLWASSRWKWIETIGTYSTSWNRSLRFLQDIQRTEGRMSLQVADPLESLFLSLQSTGLTETSSLVNQTLLLVFVKFALKQMSCVINPNKFCQAVCANAQNSGSESFKFWFHVKLGTGFRMQKATWSHKNAYLCALSILCWKYALYTKPNPKPTQ